jgi:hypothetical protein
MPNYIQAIDPILVEVYDDKSLSHLIASQGAEIDMNDLVPGLFQSELFKPSSLYASAERVAYTIHARPQHTLPPTSRVVIEMPE